MGTPACAHALEVAQHAARVPHPRRGQLLALQQAHHGSAAAVLSIDPAGASHQGVNLRGRRVHTHKKGVMRVCKYVQMRPHNRHAHTEGECTWIQMCVCVNVPTQPNIMYAHGVRVCECVCALLL